MTALQAAGRVPDSDLVVDEGRIRDGWHQVDLDGIQGRLGGPSRSDVAVSGQAVTGRLGMRWPDCASPGAPPPARRRPRLTRVPAEAFVVIGRESDESVSSTPVTANDNGPQLRAGGGRSRLRDAVFLVILAATLAGAFYSGRLHASQNVIVVPPPSSARNALT